MERAIPISILLLCTTAAASSANDLPSSALEASPAKTANLGQQTNFEANPSKLIEPITSKGERAKNGSPSTSSNAPRPVAYGQPMRPGPTPIPNIIPRRQNGLPNTSPQIFPAPILTAPQANLEQELNFQGKEQYKNLPPINSATIEYDATASGEPALRLLKSMSEAIRTGPRAAAIRANLGITQAGILTATQSNNPSLYNDRGLMAEQEHRIGPIFATDMPWEVFFRVLAAKRLVAQTKIDLLTTIWSLRSDVRRAYVELVLALETQRTLQQLYDLSAKLFYVSKKRFEAGAVPELDVLKGHLAAAQAGVDLSVGVRRITRARQQLNILMGRPVDSPIYMAALPDYTSNTPLARLRAQRNDILPDFAHDIAPLNLFVEKGIQSRLELKSIGLQLKVNQANMAVALGNIIPDPNFAMGKSTAGNEPGGPKITAVFFTLNQELPFSNVQQGNIYQYKATAYQLKYQVLSQRNQVNTDVAGAYQNLIAAREKIRVYQEKLLRDSNEVARLAQLSYESGQSDITSALLAQQANVQVRSAYLDAINSYASAFADLEQAVGRPLQ